MGQIDTVGKVPDKARDRGCKVHILRQRCVVAVCEVTGVDTVGNQHRLGSHGPPPVHQHRGDPHNDMRLGKLTLLGLLQPWSGHAHQLGTGDEVIGAVEDPARAGRDIEHVGKGVHNHRADRRTDPAQGPPDGVPGGQSRRFPHDRTTHPGRGDGRQPDDSRLDHAQPGTTQGSGGVAVLQRCQVGDRRVNPQHRDLAGQMQRNMPHRKPDPIPGRTGAADHELARTRKRRGAHEASSGRASRHHSTSCPKPSARPTSALKPNRDAAAEVSARRRATGFTRRAGPYSRPR